MALLGYGYGVQVALRAAGILGEHDHRVTVADGRFAKPLDAELVQRLAREHELVVTIEENVLPGGFGAAVLEHLEDAFVSPQSRARVMRVGLPDRYVTHGKPALLREEVGFTGEAVAERVLSRAAGPVASRPADLLAELAHGDAEVLAGRRRGGHGDRPGASGRAWRASSKPSSVLIRHPSCLARRSGRSSPRRTSPNRSSSAVTASQPAVKSSFGNRSTIRWASSSLTDPAVDCAMP